MELELLYCNIFMKVLQCKCVNSLRFYLFILIFLFRVIFSSNLLRVLFSSSFSFTCNKINNKKISGLHGYPLDLAGSGKIPFLGREKSPKS